MICSVIIRTYNEERHIGKLLDGIEKQILAPEITLEVIVVDSGSSDSTVNIARKMGARIIVIDKKDFSFGKALNIGCQNANGEILLFASAHVYPVYNNWIFKLLQQFQNKDVAIVYGKQIGNEMTHFSEHQIFLKWFPASSDFDQLHPFCNNANCAIRKSIWVKQPYDELITGLEDLDWANKIKSNDSKIIYLSDAVVVHVHEESYSKIKNRYQREAIAFKKIYPSANFNILLFMGLFLSNVFSDLYCAFRQKLLLNELINIISFRFMQFYGTYLGYNQKGIIDNNLKDRFYYPNNFKKVLKTKNRDLKSNEIDYV